MKNSLTRNMMTLLALMVVLIAGSSWGANPDPYAVLDKFVAANGGLANMEAIKTTHSKGSLTIIGAGINGTFEQWSETPMKTRQEVDLKIFKQVGGDNGSFSWSVDQNGKLQIARDSVTLKERQVRELMARNDHLSKTSRVFKVTFDRVDTAQGKPCFVLKTTNTINADVYFDFYDTTSYLELKQTVDKPKAVSHSIYLAYKQVSGVFIPVKILQVEEPVNQKVSVELDTIEVNQPIEASLFEPPASDVKDFTFANGKSVENFPFKFIENHLYIPITINGKTSIWVIDSGAESTVIEEEFAKALGLTLEGNLTGQGVGSTVQVSFTTLPAFSLEGLSFAEQKAACIKLNWLFKKTAGMEIGGILGYDFLSRVVTRVDYANQTLSFYDPDSFKYAGSGVVLDAPVTQDKMFHIPITVDGIYGGLWNLDLGAGGMAFHYPFADEHKLLDKKGYLSTGFGAGGSSQDKVSQYKTITLAGFTKTKPLIASPIRADKGAFMSKEITGNAGNTLFRHFVMYLDYKHEKVIVEKGADFDKKFPEDGSGMQVINGDDGQMEVLSVAEGTPAGKLAIKPGDKLKSINGKSPAELGGVIEVRKLFKAAPGTRYHLELERGGNIIKVELKLKALFS